ncbi:MAG: carboxypeptidase regulatory-like domain-containing protein [Planctomycetota bacterium]
MPRVLFVSLGISLLLLGVGMFLPDASVREVANTTSGNAVAVGEEADGRAALAAPPVAGSREPAERAVAATSEAVADAVPAPLTGVVGGRLVLDGGPLREATVITLRSFDAPRELIAIETDALGRFRRDGLPVDWSGSLRLSPPYRLAGESEERRFVVRVESPSDSLVIEVARDPCLRGRLTHARSELASEMDVDVRLYSSRGGYTQPFTKTDAAGRFVVVLEDLEFSKVLVEAVARDGAAGSTLRQRDSLVFDAATGDYDVGSLALYGGYEVHVRVLDPDLVPIEGAQIWFRDAPRLPAKSDARGETRFAVSDSTLDMRIAAQGFALEWFPVPSGTERTDVVMRRTNKLRVEVLDEHGQPWVGGDVRVCSDGELYASGERRLPIELVHGKQKVGRDGSVDARGRYHLFATGDDGAIEVQDLTPGEGFTVEVLDELERALFDARVEGLEPEEQRVLTLRQPPAGPRIRGRCVNMAGAPVPNAKVIVQVDDVREWFRCQPDGSFTGPEFAPGEVHVQATASGYAKSEQVVVDPSHGAVTLTLARGRTVFVELRDARGREVRMGELGLRDPNSDRFWSQRASGGEEFSFRDVPAEPLVAEFEWFSRRNTALVGAEQERVTLTVDTLGSLVVAVHPRILDPEEWLSLRLTALDGPAAGAEFVTHTPRSVGTTSVERVRDLSLWPGRYEVQLLEVRYDARRRPLPAQPYLQPLHVEVRADEPTFVTLGGEGSPTGK